MDDTIRKNPSRKECEKAIRRILITEILENGKNKHFRMATDFITYFEALYPASDSLTKQVQRAVKAMNMPNWAAAPMNRVLGLAIRGPKSVPAPTPMNIRQG